MGSFSSKQDKQIDREYTLVSTLCASALDSGLSGAIFGYVSKHTDRIEKLLENKNSWKANLLRHLINILTANGGRRETLLRNFQEHYDNKNNVDHYVIVDSNLSKFISRIYSEEIVALPRNQGVQLRM